MTPQEKADQLIQKMADAYFNNGCSVSKPAAKAAAMVCINELIYDCVSNHRHKDHGQGESYPSSEYEYWIEVRKIIETY